MTTRRWIIFVAICFTIFLAFELYALATGTPTLSAIVWAATDWFEPLALIGCFAVGLLCGHWWFPRRTVVYKTVVLDKRREAS